MRVLHVITRLIVGGAQENTIASVLGLRQRHGVEAHLLAGPTRGPEGSLEPTIARFLTLVPTLTRPVRPLADLRAYRQLLALFRQQPPDIVHTHSGKAGILGRWAAARAAVPVVIHTIHGPSFGPFQGALPNALFRQAERLAGHRTTHFVAVAEAMTAQYLAAGIGHPAQYTTVRSGFALGPFLNARNDLALRAQLGLGPQDFVVGKIARLFQLKGHDDLFAIAPRLVAAHPEIRFLFVGDGEWRARFGQQARQLGLEKHFRFTGLVPPTDVPKYLGVMDALVHLSEREGLPRALPQALAAGKPVLAYDCDGAREVCRDGETGFLIPPGDLARLAARLQQLARHPDLRTQLGAQGRELVRAQFSVEKMVDDLYALYVRLLPPSAAASSRLPTPPP